MELQEAINTVKGYLPMLPNLGEKGNEAIALVMLAAMSYEQNTWHYQYEVQDAAGASMWLDGFPTEPTRQRRFRSLDGDLEYGNWKELPSGHLKPLAKEENYS